MTKARNLFGYTQPNGYLRPFARGEKTLAGKTRWWCYCSYCGNFTLVSTSSITTEQTTGCVGCAYIRQGNTIAKDMKGEICGRLKVLHEDKNHTMKTKQRVWVCQCECGNPDTVSVPGNDLRSGHTQSCGCIWKEKMRPGPTHPSWNDSLTDEERVSNRDTPEDREWKFTVKDDADWVCHICGRSRGGKMCAHHLFARNKYPNLKYVLCNGICICDECHTTFHVEYGYGDNTPYQMYIFIQNRGIGPPFDIFMTK